MNLFDDGAKGTGDDDSDIYDDNNDANDPNNPIWDGSEVRTNPYGVDPAAPDANEVNQD